MRLQPIEKPKGLMMRIAYMFTRRQFGKVMTPMKVLLARMPGSMRFSYQITNFELKGIRLDHELHFMIGTLASQINGCGFCVDLGRSMAIREQLGMDKFNALAEYRTSPLFSDRERAALAYVEEATRHRRVSDATFENLRKHFTESGDRGDHLAERAGKLLQPDQYPPRDRIRWLLRHHPGTEETSAGTTGSLKIARQVGRRRAHNPAVFLLY